jgi:hypothetical protein
LRKKHFEKHAVVLRMIRQRSLHQRRGEHLVGASVIDQERDGGHLAELASQRAHLIILSGALLPRLSCPQAGDASAVLTPPQDGFRGRPPVQRQVWARSVL